MKFPNVYLRRLPAWTYILGIVAIIALGCWLMSEYQDLVRYGQYVMPLLTFMLGWRLVSLPRRYVENKGLLVLFFLALVIMGIKIYSSPVMLPSGAWLPTRVLYPVSNALSTFFPSRGDYAILAESWGEGKELCTPMFAFWFYLFHYLSYFFLAWMGFSLFGRQMLNRFSEATMCYKRKDLFWGYSEGGYELAKDIMKKQAGEEPVFLLDDSEDADRDKNLKLVAKLGDRGIVAFNVDFQRLVTDGKYFGFNPLKRLKRMGRYFGGHRQFFITEDQDFNVSLALVVLDQLKANKAHLKGRTTLYVRSEQPGIDSLFQSKLSEGALGQNVGVRVFSQSDLTSRRFVMNHPVLGLSDLLNREGKKLIAIDHDQCTVGGDVHILILGLGWTGFDLMTKIVADAAFGKDFHLHITVVDDDYRHKHGYYQFIVEEACRQGVDIVVNPAVWVDEDDNIVVRGTSGARRRVVHSVNGMLFYRWLAKGGHILDFNRIIVALGDDELNINTALQLTRFRYDFLGASYAGDISLMPERIMAHVRNRDRYSYYDNDTSPIITFGSMKQIYSCKVLIAEEMDRVAKLVNLVYNKKTAKLPIDKLLRSLETTADNDSISFIDKGEADRLWGRCSIFDKDSSRAVALNIPNIMTIIGCDKAGSSEEKFSLCVEKCIDSLAELEHLRWNAFHFMRGIKVMPLTDINSGSVKISYNGVLVKHGCLVPYADLPAVSERANEFARPDRKRNDKENDRRIVRHFHDFISCLNTPLNGK